MAIGSLKDALGLLRHPTTWSVGLIVGGFTFAAAATAILGEVLYSEPLALLLFLVVPFFAGGIYGAARSGTFSSGVFVESGKTYYFKILLPGLVIFFATFLTIFLLAIPIALLGAGAIVSMVPLTFGVLASIVFLTFFYDTVAVFEETNVFESIRRSIEFVMNNLGRTLLFYLINFIAFVVLWFAGSFAWTMLLADKLEAITSMNPAEIAEMMPQDILALVGTDGMWLIAGITAVVVVLFSAFLYAYKVSFFQNHSVARSTRMPQGVYDEKGRWYKY